MQTIYDGNHDFSLLQQVKEACAGIDLSKRTAAVRDQLSEVASQFRVERTKLRRLAKTAEQIKSFDLALEGPGLTPPASCKCHYGARLRIRLPLLRAHLSRHVSRS